MVRGRAGKVLILSPQVMTAALVGWYVELAMLEPAFAAPGEQPEEALARVKPILVVLVDAELEQARSDLLVARAKKRGVGFAVFGSAEGNEDARAWTTQRGVQFFQLPVDLEGFGRVLDHAARTGDHERRGEDRRDRAATHRAVDGTLMFFDGAGSAWYVYDRRSGDRRIDGQKGMKPYRSFIGIDGMERRCHLDDVEFAAREPAELVAQLARSAQVPPNHS